MAKKQAIPEVDVDAAPDGAASVILREGPAAGAYDVLPDGSEVFRNEVHVPVPGAVAIYQRKKPEAGLPTYRHVRNEPVYAIET